MTKTTRKKGTSTENVTDVKETKEIKKETKTEATEVKAESKQLYLVPEQRIWSYTGPKYKNDRAMLLTPGIGYKIAERQSAFVILENGTFVKVADGGFSISEN